MKRQMSILGIAAMLAAAGTANAQMAVNEDLGTLGFGSTNLVNDTANGANNATLYEGITNPASNWGNEYVYQFTLTGDAVVSLFLNSVTNDADFFLLDGLDVAPDLSGTGKPAAQDTIAFAFLDFPPEGQQMGIFGAGTYFLSVDAFNGADPGDGTNATFDLDLIIDAVPGPPSSFIDLGAIAGDTDMFTIDSFGSDFDTELGLYDNNGILLDNNDDSGGGLQSELIVNSLAQGDYWVALGGFNTTFGDGFGAIADSSSADGNGVLNYNGQTTTAAVGAGEVQWFRFTVTPATSSIALLGLGGLAMTRRRRA